VWYELVSAAAIRRPCGILAQLLPCFRDLLIARPRTEHSRIVVHMPGAGRRYPSNRIINTKYTALSFLTLNLWEQFRRPLNQYFFLISCLQLIPLTTMGPLLAAFVLTMCKELGDDFRRRSQDVAFNRKPYLACQGACRTAHAADGASLLADPARSACPVPAATPPAGWDEGISFRPCLRQRRRPAADGTHWVRPSAMPPGRRASLRVDRRRCRHLTSRRVRRRARACEAVMLYCRNPRPKPPHAPRAGNTPISTRYVILD
jgi:hypothetical protein